MYRLITYLINPIHILCCILKQDEDKCGNNRKYMWVNQIENHIQYIMFILTQYEDRSKNKRKYR